MDKLEKLYNGAFIVMFIIAIYIFVYYKMSDQDDPDVNHDGIVTNKEMTDYINRQIDKRKNSPPGFTGIVKSSMNGAFRGALTGMILNGWEGAVTSAVILGIINPIVTSVEHMY